MASRLSHLFTHRSPHDEHHPVTIQKNHSLPLSKTTKQKRNSITSLLITIFKSSLSLSPSTSSQTSKSSKQKSRGTIEPVFVTPWIDGRTICVEPSSLPRRTGGCFSDFGAINGGLERRFNENDGKLRKRGKVERQKRDSGYSNHSASSSLATYHTAQSSISTIPSDSLSPPKTLILSPEQFHHLNRTIRRINRSLQKLIYLTHHLHTNLVFLIERKKRCIERCLKAGEGKVRWLQGERRWGEKEKREMVLIMGRLGECVARWGRRREGVLGGGLGVLGALGNEEDGNDTDEQKGERMIDYHLYLSTLQTLTLDLQTQRELDEALKECILGVCGEENLLGIGCQSERVGIRRFVRFFGERMRVLEEVLGVLGRRVEEGKGILGEL